jgi:hypothetical protein
VLLVYVIYNTIYRIVHHHLNSAVLQCTASLVRSKVLVLVIAHAFLACSHYYLTWCARNTPLILPVEYYTRDTSAQTTEFG